MKKSKVVRLLLLGSAGVGLTACDQGPPPDAQFVTGPADCAFVQDVSACREAIAQSEKKFEAEAPRFAGKEACETEFGADNCEPRQVSDGGSFFMPMLMGYMLGRGFQQPVYRGPNNSALLRSGGGMYTVGRFASAGRAATFQPSRITPTPRGGFGRTAAFRGSPGG
jgi:uncharacterized protein YgiB involved in biofilm formation